MSADRDSFIELDLPSGDALPAWVATLLVAIGAIVPIPADAAFAALRALVDPLRVPGAALHTQWLVLPEPHKSIVRAAKDAKLAEIKAHERPSAAERQPLSVVRDPSPVAPAAPVVTQAPFRGERTDATTAPRIASYTKIKTGPAKGDWGVSVPAGSAYVRVGDIVIAEANSGRRSRKRLTGIVVATDTYTIATCEDAPLVADTAPQFVRDFTPAADIVPASQISPSGLPVVASMTLTPRAASPSVISVGDSVIETSLAAVAAEIPAPLVPVTRPVTRSPSRLQATPTNTANDVRKQLTDMRDMIIGGLVDGAMLQVSWTVGEGTGGSCETTVGAVSDALIAIEREGDAPPTPSATAYAGKSVEYMRNRSLDTTRLPNADLPEGVSARWLVGNKLTGKNIVAGDPYGNARLIVDLRDDGTLAFDGDITLSMAVRSHYSAATARETLRSNVLTPWLQRILRTRHGAVKKGHNWYVPGGQADAVRALIGALEPLWGDFDLNTAPMGMDLTRNISRALDREVSAVMHDFSERTNDAKELASKKATKVATAIHGATAEYIAQQADMASRRATVSSDVAARLLLDLGKAAARVAGYETAFGADSVANAKTAIAALRETLNALTNDGPFSTLDRGAFATPARGSRTWKRTSHATLFHRSRAVGAVGIHYGVAPHDAARWATRSAGVRRISAARRTPS